MRVLVACEESQAVTIEFRKLGIEAFSCDIKDCTGGHPEWHINKHPSIDRQVQKRGVVLCVFVLAVVKYTNLF